MLPNTSRLPTAPRQHSDRVMFLYDGQPRNYREIRSSYINAFSRALNQHNSRYDAYSLAEAYSVGITSWACTNLRADILSKLKPVVETHSGVQVDINPASHFLENAPRLLWWMSASLDIWGKAYLIKTRNRFNLPTGIAYISPLDVQETWDVDQTRVTEYWCNHHRYAPSDIIRLSLFSPFGHLDTAVSPFQMAFKRIAAEVSLVEWSAAFFANSARPDGILAYEGDLSDEEYQRTKLEWSLFRGAKNAFKTFFGASQSGGRWNWFPITPQPTDLAMKDFTQLGREDTCAIFQTHPSLVGLSGISDPLSASSTYDALWADNIQHIAVPRGDWICDELTRQWLRPDFPFLEDSIRLRLDLTGINIVTQATADRSTTASSNLSAHLWRLDEAREFVGSGPAPEGYLQANPDWVLPVWQGNLVKRNEARVMLGLKPLDEDDMFYTETQVPPDQRGLGDEGPPAVGPGGESQDPQPSQPSEIDTGLQDARDEVEIDGSIVLSLANQPDIVAIQRRILGEHQEHIRKVTAPKDLHITLISLPVIREDQLEPLRAAVQKIPFPHLTLTIGSLGSFDSLGQYAVFLRIRQNQALRDLQSRLYEAALSVGLKPSHFSTPKSFIPHITLAYATQKIAITFSLTSLVVTPDSVDFSIDRGNTGKWEVIASRPLSQVQPTWAPTRGAIEDLSTWRRKVRNKGPRTEFTSENLPDPVRSWVSTQLDEGWAPSEVFNEAQTWLMTGRAEPPLLGATRAEYDEYWDDFDSTPNRIGKVWTEYQTRLSKIYYEKFGADPLTWPRDEDEYSFDQVKEAQDQLRLDLVGTPDEPGPLGVFFLKGAAAGQRQLQSGRRDSPSATIQTTWETYSKEAAEFLSSQGAEMVKNIDSTTRQRIRVLLSQAVKEGWSRDELANRLSEHLVLPGKKVSAQVLRRAKRIAQTESIQAFNHGALERWQKAGASEAVWKTVSDTHVCKVCRGLHNQRGTLTGGWKSSVTGKTYRLLAHIGCRCFRRVKAPELRFEVV